MYAELEAIAGRSHRFAKKDGVKSRWACLPLKQSAALPQAASNSTSIRPLLRFS